MDVFNDEIMDPIFNFLELTRGIEDDKNYHPEEDVFNHSIQTMNLAFRESVDTDLIIAAMLHDVGKAENSKGHENIGAELIQDYVSAKTHWLVKNHMRFWYFIKGEMKKLSKVKNFGNHPWIPELCFLARWDKIGRRPVSVNYDREQIITRLNKCVDVHFEISQLKIERISHEIK